MLMLLQEFSAVVRVMRQQRIRYAVVGGLAVAVYGLVRATKDLDFLVFPKDFDRLAPALKQHGYHEARHDLFFADTGLRLKRFWKVLPGAEDVTLVDVLLAETTMHQRMLKNALLKKWGRGYLRVARPADLIKMKQARGSLTDQSDIKALKHVIRK